jgi:dihydrodipicolinate synthase/N-acetylneuraminate lyase
VLCGLGDLRFASTAAPGCPAFVSWTANFVPELSLERLDAADACDFRRVHKIIGRSSRPYDFAGIRTLNRGSDFWVLTSLPSGHVYVGS